MKHLYLSTFLTFSFFFLNAQTTSDNNPNFTLTTEGTCICATAANGETGTFFTGTPNEITYTKRTRADLDALISADENDPQIALTCTSGITDMSSLFFLKNLFNQDISSWDVSNVTDMVRMFSNAYSFNQPLNDWDVSSVTNMSQMFLSADSFNQPLNDWDVSQVTDMSLMFGFAVLFNQPLNDWDVSQVTDMAGMFQNNNLFNQPLNDWDVSNVTTMAEMFFGATAFTQPLNDWDVSSVTIMSNLFGFAESFNRPLNDWDVSGVNDMSDMFGNASLFNQDLSNWCVANIASEPSNFSVSSSLQESFKPVWGTCLNPNFTLAPNGVTCLCPDAAIGESGTLLINGVSKTFTKRTRTQLDALIANDQSDPQIALTCTSGITDMSSLFANTTLFNQDISSWDTSSVTDMSFMFIGDDPSFGPSTAFNQPINDWDVSSVTNMNAMFRNSSFNQPLNNWDVSSVTNMNAMFSNSNFNQALNNWVTSSATDMASMFQFSIFNQPINDWVVSNVTNMDVMFNNSNFNQPLNSWDVSAVTSMAQMFSFATSFNQPLNDWDVSGVTDMDAMFAVASSFNQPLNDWDVSGVTDMLQMFAFATSFNQSLNDWDVSGVTDMVAMFEFASSFNQPLNEWDVSSVNNMNVMFSNASSFNQDISNWCVANIISEPTNFSFNSPLQESFKPVWGTCLNPNFTLAPNGVTCLCPDAAIGESGTLLIDGVSKTFTKRDRTQLLALIANDENDPQIALTCTSGITAMSSLFLNRTSFNQDISSWDVSNVTNMSFMFSNASSFSQPLNDWDVSGVTDMNRMFNDAESFNQPLNDWNVSNVTNMRSMFFDAPDFNQPLDNWDVSNVTNMIGMFGGFDFQTTFNQPIDDWDVSQVTTMVAMFQNNISFNQPLNDWDVANVINMRIMFLRSSAFNQPLNNWNVSNVTSMSFMFSDATSFDQALNNWNVSGVTTMSGMFGGFDSQTTFNQPINDWNVSQVTNMFGMFQNNISFNQPLNDWDVSSVTAMEFMFFNASSFDQDISNWCVENILSEPDDFSTNSPLQSSFKPNWGTCPVTSLTFQEVFTSPTAALASAVAFADVDYDGDQDFIISGATQRNQFGLAGGQISRLYKNNGSGSFGIDNSVPFMGLSYSSISYKDLNNDSFLDVILTGENYSNGTNFNKFYGNDGAGNFSAISGPSFPNMDRIDMKIADFDGDNVDDVLFIGLNPVNGNAAVRLFRNQGTELNPSYFNVTPSILDRIVNGSIAVADVDGDNTIDIFISGKRASGEKISKIYLNNGNIQFTQLAGTSFAKVDSGDSSFADVDNDGDQDLLISGKDASNNNILKLYLNDGSGNFSEAVGAINISSDYLLEAFDFADIDGDTDKDVLLTGYNTTTFSRITTIWNNLLFSPRSPNSMNTSEINIDVDQNQVSFGYKFSLYPNPTDKAYFNTYMPNMEGKVSVDIIDVYGRLMLSKNMSIKNEKITVNTQELAKGIYVVRFTQGVNTFSTKVIIE